jgi:hypothetical protein
MSYRTRARILGEKPTSTGSLSMHKATRLWKRTTQPEHLTGEEPVHEADGQAALHKCNKSSHISLIFQSTVHASTSHVFASEGARRKDGRRTLLLVGMATSTCLRLESESAKAITGTFTYEASFTACRDSDRQSQCISAPSLGFSASQNCSPMKKYGHNRVPERRCGGQ